jgi:hypothetical protein
MSTDPLVSILIAAFNAERWIADTLRSAIGQTWPNKEIIVVDDGSTDGTLNIAQKFASNIVRGVAHENEVASGAGNKALSLCQGTTFNGSMLTIRFPRPKGYAANVFESRSCDISVEKCSRVGAVLGTLTSVFGFTRNV